MADGGRPAGFSKGVNEYLHRSVTIADAKATTLLAMAVTVGAGVLQIQTSSRGALLARSMSILALALSVAVNASVIFPRLPSGRRGLVFWEDVRRHTDVESYMRAIAGLTDADMESEYAAQNYFVSDVLYRKHRWVRRGVVSFLAGIGSGMIAYLMK